MKELTIKELAPYLPYELNISVVGEGSEDLSEIIGLSQITKLLGVTDDTAILGDQFDDQCLEGIKPILRPLSDLTKEIEHNGKKFVPMELFVHYKDRGLPYLKEQIYLGLVETLIFQKLCEYHFDVFGLIEADKAIDINALKEK